MFWRRQSRALCQDRWIRARVVSPRRRYSTQNGHPDRQYRKDAAPHRPFWTELRAADANIDDRADRLAGIAAPMAAAHALGKRAHFLKRLMNQCRMRRMCIAGAQRGMQRCPFLSGIDNFAREHRIALLLNARLA